MEVFAANFPVQYKKESVGEGAGMRRLAAYIGVFLFALLFCRPASAAEVVTTMSLPIRAPMEVTSPFGWRIHPIYGDQRYHSGCDLAGDYGDEIQAAASGTVSYAGWLDGYGYTVIIEHGNGLSTLYGHNEEVLVSAGQDVTRNQLIAYCGSTGNSTGPHCHFEVELDGELLDPGLFVPGLLAAEQAEGGGNNLPGGAAVPRGTDDHGGAADFIVNKDFAKTARDIIEKFISVLTEALGYIRQGITEIFIVLCTMDLAVGAAYKTLVWSAGDGGGKGSLAKWMLEKVLFYGLMLFLLLYWSDIIGNLSMHGLPALGGIAGGATPEKAAAAVSDPSKIIQKGVQIIAPVINNGIKGIGGSDFLFGSGVSSVIFSLVFGLLIFACFTIIGLQIGKAYLEFYFVILFSFTGMVFSGMKHVRRFASNGLNGVFAVSINLMFFCLLAVSLQHTMETMAIDSFLTTQTASESEKSATAATKIQSLDELMSRMRIVESYYGNYHCDNGLGYYGAYQINVDYYDAWCDDYEASSPSVALDTDENYTRWTEYGPYDTAPEPTSTAHPWSPRNQELITAFILQGYYERYHSWEAAGRAWNQGEGGMENGEAYKYQEQLYGKKTASTTMTRALNIWLLIKLLVVCLLFMYIGDRLRDKIMKQFGGMGFRLTNEQ